MEQLFAILDKQKKERIYFAVEQADEIKAHAKATADTFTDKTERLEFMLLAQREENRILAGAAADAMLQAE